MLIEIIKNTPFWVYLILALLIYRGAMSMKAKTMKLIKLFIMPVIFLFLISQKMGNIPTTYVAFLILGCFIGWLLYRNAEIRADKVKKLILVPGSVIPMILILFAFGRGYYVGYETAVHPELVKAYWFAFSISATSGITSGIFIFRTITYLYKYLKAEHEDFSNEEISRSKKVKKCNI